MGTEGSKCSAFCLPGSPASTFELASSGATEGVSLEMKSATTYPFSGCLGLNCMSNSPNSIAHLINQPDASGFWSTCRSGWLVKTVISCAWKHGRSLRAETTIAKASCSKEGTESPHSATPY
ncbi:unnamed protein product [Prunus armeniaca]